MAAVVFYFQMHQPRRLGHYNLFAGRDDYFDDATNARILNRVADLCYSPFADLLLELVRQHGEQFRFAISITGSLIEQLQIHRPHVIDQYRRLIDTGQVELLSETYHHSLAFLYSRDEFDAQVALHRQLMEQTFGQTPHVFRNTELIYNDQLASHLHDLDHYKGVLTEGADSVLGYRSPNHVYRSPSGMKLLVKNYRLSDDIAFRFSDQQWVNWPLDVDKFTRFLDRYDPTGSVTNLFMDIETFGEHQKRDSGIYDFFRSLVDRTINADRHAFRTPGDVLVEQEAQDEYNVPHTISWADTERDASAWIGNAMQSSALHEIYRLEARVKAADDQRLLNDWRQLTTSDHFYYMATKYHADGQVHKYFNPYASPYDAYINFMNVLEHLRNRVGRE